MPHTNSESKIFSFFIPSDIEHAEFAYLHFVTEDGFTVFVAGVLSSNHLSDLKTYIELGLSEVKVQFSALDLPILERLIESIYKAGDFLAGELASSKQPLKDIDFSVEILAFKDDYVYICSDGNLNCRVYRNSESLLVNESQELQFNGSMEVQLGDVFCLSTNEFLLQSDTKHIDYILEKEQPSYPALYLDYQMELQDRVPSSEDTFAGVTETVEEENDVEISMHNQKPADERLQQIAAKLRYFFVRAFAASKKVYSYCFDALSSPLDRIYAVALKKSSHEVKRFQSSTLKTRIQHGILIFLVVLFVLSLVLFTSSRFVTTSKNSVTTKQNSKKVLQDKFNTLSADFNAVSINSFTMNYSEFKTLAAQMKNNGDVEESFITSLLSQAQDYEDRLYNIKPIQKVDGVFLSSTIKNVRLVDFSVVGTDVYALDAQNSQVLKGNSQQQFEVVSKNDDYKSMSQLACIPTACYVLDQEDGLLILDLASGQFSKYKGLSRAGEGVKEMTYAFESIYTLVPSSGQLLKYAKFGEGFKAAAQWNSSTGFDTETSDFAVDGSIFEITTQGELKRYFNGKLDTTFNGLQVPQVPFGSGLQIAMTPAREEGVNRLYIADPANTRIVVYDKSMDANKQFTFVGSYKYRGSSQISFNTFQDIYLSTDEKLLYILENNMVYKIRVTEL